MVVRLTVNAMWMDGCQQSGGFVFGSPPNLLLVSKDKDMQNSTGPVWMHEWR
jgi:hypothetical protein